MSDLDLARKNPETLLWRELDKVHAGLLWVEGSGQHPQPMAHHVDRDGRRLWFLTRRDSDLVRAMSPGCRAGFVVVSKAQDFHASLAGPLSISTDRAKLDDVWSAASAAWFEGGKDDASVTLLCLAPDDAAIWASTANSLAYAWEIARANVVDSTPDVGVRNAVAFA